MQSLLTQELIDLFHRGLATQLQVKYRHRHIRRRHTNRITRKLALQFRNRFGHSLSRTRGGQHHIQCRTATATITFVIVINQVLVIGVRMDGFNMAAINTILIKQALEHRYNGIGGAGGRRNNFTLWGDFVVINAVDNIRNIITRWRG